MADLRPNPITTVVRAVLGYVAFVWAVTWRSAVVAMSAAVLSGVSLGVVASAQGWSEPQIAGAANMIGAPIAMMAVLGVVALRLLALRRSLG